MRNTFLFLLAFTLIISACKQEPKKEETAAVKEVKPVVYTSNYPVYFFTKNIGGEAIEVHFPAGDLSDPSTWSPVPDTIAGMQSADLILVNGASFENWLMNVSLPEDKVVNTSSNFQDQLLSSGETFTHSHGDEGEHAHEGTAFTTWLNLELAAKQAEEVKNALIALQPENKSLFENNHAALAKDLMTLHSAYQHTLASQEAPAVAFSHPVYQYLTAAYGLKGKSLHWEPETPLDHDMIHEIEHLKKDHNIKFLIWEGEPLPENIEKLNAMGISSVVITPMGGMPEGTDFIQGMKQNLEVLKGIMNDE
ncbi:zinc ABC transporter substrate-binding protein [Robertkochia marina]|uniref:Zinc ABC transporter substrate-binding protein n=1 Tax=Robertkochia marina TaxID=1227945 RepID=A0A4S3LZA8_9FLAO|nr:metal ABC transporter substrate-binding protein [Robertkochia marina]THD65693.1 zinc ABC transporter substrate-binding protein [Robertkochia marina]TRZ46623.1 zinc ABC transporter substrate-binding protein [Robertkochia marina]